MTERPTGEHETNRQLIAPLRAALFDYEPEAVQRALGELMVPDAPVMLAHPFEDLDGPAGWFGEALAPLGRAWPDLERRDWIVMAGDDTYGNAWIGCAGDYVGTFVEPWLGIPPTGHPTSMRFHEFFRVEDGRVVEMQALWDLPEVMLQAGAWPLAPSLGRELQAPAPAGQDGLITGPRDAERSQASVEHVVGMLEDMGRHPAEPVEAMRLDHWWHPRFSWYGPAGIGSSRGADGFRRIHQIPFLKSMPDRRGGGYTRSSHFFGDGDYVGETAWPGMEMTITGDGWLGIPPLDEAITMRSLDFWRMECHELPDGTIDRKIRENWVLVDLLHVYDQIGVDVLARMRELVPGRR